MKILEEGLASAKEIYHQIECGIYNQYELDNIISRVQCNIERIEPVLRGEDLKRTGIIKDGIIRCATKFHEYFMFLDKLIEYLLECRDIFSVFGMTTECEYVSMICGYARYDIRSSEELDFILDGKKSIIKKLVAVGALQFNSDAEYLFDNIITECYYESRRGYEELKIYLSQYIYIYA